ncbi:MyTH4 and SH3 9 domain containing protein [Trichuris trichiura]|uniref:MyTH4 and SH3 9 domain containing protein n=1 Tax=Trichuris trichiura TaxID=36087 RepID=A0A077Z3Z1_TRITR|nr:MyTH4 and SH3 9 domain containing protein [Trichuris trichiura]
MLLSLFSRPMPPGQSSINAFGNWHVSSCYHLSNSFFDATGSGSKLVSSISRQPEQMDSQKSLLKTELLNAKRSLSNENSDLERCTIVSENGSVEPEVDEDMNRKLVGRSTRGSVARISEERGDQVYDDNCFFPMGTILQLFFPSETLQHTASINAIFHQIVRDCFNEQNNFRLEKKHRIQMLRLLSNLQRFCNFSDSNDLSISFKKHVIQIARSWPLYFCRLYPVMVKSESNIPRYLAISESGVWIIAKERDISREGGSSIIECFEYDELDREPVHAALITDTKTLTIPKLRATSDYVTAEPNLLSFRKGQVIQLVKTISGVHPGWLYGKIDSNYGFFPKEHLQTVEEEDETDLEVTALGPREKLTMMEFAMQHFRKNLMIYMGDYPLKKDANYMDCVYKILAACRDHPMLRDEVYCQVIKQLTNNKSSKPDSALMGWRMLSILTSYFDSSDVLRPYLLKHLKEAASDGRRPYHGTASECYQNFKQTLQFGGRKCLLSPKELDSISQGKNLKRQVYHLPGGTKKVINTKAVTVVEEVIRQLCQDLNIKSSLEQQEFSLCVVVETSQILSNDEYILDVTTELENNGLDYFILLKRIVWMHPLRKDSVLYTDIMFFQILPDYLEGLLVIMRGPDSLSAATMDDIASLGALLVCADEGWDGQFVAAQDVGTFLPKTVFQVRHVSMELWADRVNQKLRMLSPNTSRTAARAAFLGTSYANCIFFTKASTFQICCKRGHYLVQSSSTFRLV